MAFIQIIQSVFIAASAIAAPSSNCRLPEGFRPSDFTADFGPIRHQDSIGWCYSFGAADQLGRWMLKNRLGPDTRVPSQMISPVASALAYNSSSRQRALGYTQAQGAYLRSGDDAKAQFQKRLPEINRNYDKLVAPWMNKIASISSETRPYMSGENLQLFIRDQSGQPPLSPEERARFQQNQKAMDQIQRRASEVTAELNRQIRSNPELRRAYVEKNRSQGELLFFLGMDNDSGSSDFKEPEGGDTIEVYRQAILYGLCFEKDVPSFSKTSAQANWDLIELKALVNSLNRFMKNPSFDNRCLAATDAKKLFPNLAETEIDSILASSGDSDPLDALLLKACKPFNFPTDRIPTTKIITGGQQDLIEKISGAVGKTSVGIAYHPEIFSYTGSKLDAVIKDSKSGHYSVLAGQQFNCETGEVEFLLRNSWGAESCEANRRDFEAEIQQPKRTLFNCMGDCETRKGSEREACYVACDQEVYEQPSRHVPFTCKNGYYVVPKSTLQRGIIRADYLE